MPAFVGPALGQRRGQRWRPFSDWSEAPGGGSRRLHRSGWSARLLCRRLSPQTRCLGLVASASRPARPQSRPRAALTVHRGTGECVAAGWGPGPQERPRDRVVRGELCRASLKVAGSRPADPGKARRGPGRPIPVRSHPLARRSPGLTGRGPWTAPGSPPRA